ncbi:MAG: carbohydrate kinase family protein [Actinomycetota bacterium]
MSGFDVLVLGDANPDLVLSGDAVEPAFGQAERLVDEARLVIGGSGAIFACGAAKLGLRVAFAGVVGDDMFGRFMREQLREHGVDTSAVAVLAERPTGVTVVLSGPEDRAMLTFAGTIGDLRRSMIDADMLSRSRHIHVSSYFLQRDLVPELRDLFHEARREEATTSLDPNWDPAGTWDGGLMALLPEVDVFLPNEVEALSMARISVVEDAIARLRSSGAGTVVVKSAGRGAVAAQASDLVAVPALPTRVVDPTGAGDSFDAGFIAGFLEGEPLRRCLEIGNACGALSTLGIGGTSTQPTMIEALDAIERGSVK